MLMFLLDLSHQYNVNDDSSQLKVEVKILSFHESASYFDSLVSYLSWFKCLSTLIWVDLNVYLIELLFHLSWSNHWGKKKKETKKTFPYLICLIPMQHMTKCLIMINEGKINWAKFCSFYTYSETSTMVTTSNCLVHGFYFWNVMSLYNLDSFAEVLLFIQCVIDMIRFSKEFIIHNACISSQNVLV